jgi:hypothetical protein
MSSATYKDTLARMGGTVEMEEQEEHYATIYISSHRQEEHSATTYVSSCQRYDTIYISSHQHVEHFATAYILVTPVRDPLRYATAYTSSHQPFTSVIFVRLHTNKRTDIQVPGLPVDLTNPKPQNPTKPIPSLLQPHR